MINTYKIGELLNILISLFEKTERLYDSVTSESERQIPLAGVYLSEIYTLKEKADLYLTITEELQHYEISSLLSFWDETYFQLKKVIEQNDSNTSWLCSRFENYKDQHETVVQMLRDIS